MRPVLISLFAFAALVSAGLPPTFTLTVFQPASFSLAPSQADLFAALNETMAAAAAAGSSLVVCPELFSSGYNPLTPFEGEARGGPRYTAAASLAASHNVSLLFTYPERGSDGALYDAAVLFNRSGAPLLDYRKVNLAPDGEALVFAFGDEMAPVVELDGVRVGVIICFDVFLPEPARILALGEVDLILIPTANGYPPTVFNSLAKLIVPARALENSAFVAYVNWYQPGVSPDGLFTFYGQSIVVDDGGSVLFEGPSDAGVTSHVLLNFTGRVRGNTAQGRPHGDTAGLCAP